MPLSSTPHHFRQVRQAALACGLGALLWLRQPALQAAGDSVAYKFQDYREGAGRIRVLAHYAQWDVGLHPRLRLRLTGLTDAISGASPTGMPPEQPGGPVPTARLPDETRRSLVGAFEWAADDATRLNLEYSYSDEPDYLARGMAATWVREFNRRNTTLRAGFAHLNDTVKSSPIGTDRLNWDFLLGVTHLLDPHTTLTCNLGYGFLYGYLGDPYKVVAYTERVEIPLPGQPPIVIENRQGYYENRPARREKALAYVRLQRFVDRLDGAVDAAYRYFRDDWGIASHTIEAAWLQNLGRSWVLAPAARYYRQSAADFYHTTLDTTGIVPTRLPSRSAPYYSADHRLSAMDTWSVGGRLIWKPGERFTFDIAYERYVLRGRDGRTERAMYPRADIVTIGARYAF